jgi:hypothetical protein
VIQFQAGLEFSDGLAKKPPRPIQKGLGERHRMTGIRRHGGRNQEHKVPDIQAEGTGTHALHLVDWQGHVVCAAEEGHLVAPREFATLARFLGLSGEAVDLSAQGD